MLGEGGKKEREKREAAVVHNRRAKKKGGRGGPYSVTEWPGGEGGKKNKLGERKGKFVIKKQCFRFDEKKKKKGKKIR